MSAGGDEDEEKGKREYGSVPPKRLLNRRESVKLKA